MSDPHPARALDREDKRTFLQKLVEFIHPGPDSIEELVVILSEAEDNELIGPESRVMLERVLRMAERSLSPAMGRATDKLDQLRERLQVVTRSAVAPQVDMLSVWAGVRAGVAALVRRP